MAFIVNLDALSDQSDITADDNGGYFNGFGRVMRVYSNVDEKRVYVKSISGTEDPLDDGKSDHFILTKYNGTAKSCKDFHRKIMRLKLKGSRRYFQYCLLQYSFEGEDRNFDIIQHGNSKRKHPYKQTATSIRPRIKEHVAYAKPSEAMTMTRKQLGGTSKATSSGMVPRNIKQIQNMSYMKSSSSFTSSKDVLASLMEHCKTTLNDPDKSFIRRVEGAPEPMCVVDTEVAFSDLERFCCKDPQGLNSIMTVDPTFNFGEFYFTPITFKNLAVHRKLTGQPKIDVDPGLIHQRKVFSSYYYFSSSLVGTSSGLSELKCFQTEILQKAFHLRIS